jgi:hypothetical protein
VQQNYYNNGGIATSSGLSATNYSTRSGHDHRSDMFKRIERFFSTDKSSIDVDKSMEMIKNIASLTKDIDFLKESKNINQKKLRDNLLNLRLFLIELMNSDCSLKLVERNPQYLRNP